MRKYIDADKLEKDGWSIQRIRQVSSTEMVYETKKPTDFPAADVQEVKHGRWVEFSPLRNMFSCSLCGQWGDRLWNYCPHCGSRMDLEGEEE